jgi:hypothetical protein
MMKMAAVHETLDSLGIQGDALDSFLKIATLVQMVLKIEYANGSVKLNPLLEAYLAAHTK